MLSLTLHKVYSGEITDDDIPLMPTFFYDLPSTLPRWNLYIFVNSRSGRGHALDGGSLQLFSLPEVFTKAGFQTTDGCFVVPDAYYFLHLTCPPTQKVSESDDIAVTAYVFDSHEGLELAKESLSLVVFVVQFDIDSDAHHHFTGIDTLDQNPSNFYPKL